MKRWNVVLRLASLSVPEKIDTAKVIIFNMTGNEYFVSPTPALKEISKLADELQTAYEASRDSGKEETAFMNAKAFELVTELNVLSNYVEAVANNDTEIGDVIIFSAGMDVKRTTNRQEQQFAVKNLEHSGFVFITSKIERRASYVWQYSLDQVTWTDCNITRASSITIKELTPGSLYYFRVAVVTEEQGPWQGPISIIVT